MSSISDFESARKRRARDNIVNVASTPDVNWLRLAPAPDNEYRRTLAATLANLKESGLDQDIERLGIIPLTSRQIIELLNRHYAMRGDEFYEDFDYYGFVIPYFDLDNRRIDSHARIRILAPDDEFEQYKVRKYVQFDPSSKGYDDKQRATSPRFYLTPGINWREIATDPNVEINFTEGEKSAAKPSLSGVIYIGLGGIDAFTHEEEIVKGKRGRPKRGRNPPIKDFKLLRWKGRSVGISYDAEENPNTREAETRLGATLLGFEAKAFRRRLACDCAIPCKDVDALVTKHGIDALKQLEREAFDKTDILSRDYAVLLDPAGAVYAKQSRKLIRFRDFRVATEDQRTVVWQNNAAVEVPAADIWIRKVPRFTRLVFEPSTNEQVIADPDPERDGQALNLWRGLTFEPRRGNIDPYLELLAFGSQLEPRIAALFENWTAAALQQPGLKIKYAILVFGDQQGSGKTLLGRTIAGLYGANALVISDPDRLHAKFNRLLQGRTFVLANEVVRSRVEAERLKGLVTEPEITIEPKGFEAYQVTNYVNLYLTSNHPDALKLEVSTRRFLVWEWPKWPDDKKRATFFRDYHRWLYVYPDQPERGLRAEAGAALTYHFLLERDLKRYDPHADAPATTAKLKVITHTKDDIEIFAAQLAELGPRVALGLEFFPVMSTTHLLKLFSAQAQRQARSDDAQKLGKALGTGPFRHIVVQSRDRQHTAPLWALDQDWVDGRKAADIYDEWVRLIAKPTTQKILAAEQHLAALRAEAAKLEAMNAAAQEREKVRSINTAKPRSTK